MFEALVERARTDPRVRVHSGASATDIRRAEESLEVSFPPEYAEFLGRFGHAAIGHTRVHGLGGDDVDDVTRCTLAERTGLRECMGFSSAGWTDGIVVVADRGNGDFHYLRAAEPYRGRAPVLCWDHELDERLIVAMNFADWLDAILGNPHYILPRPIH